ncbi:hypothetical protein CY35_17G095600 [Sphagnum magellanicum]|jgi:hypothetical protein|nr:hypothetical protein CY35_17G095600 [Sphagnum magellanicum]
MAGKIASSATMLALATVAISAVSMVAAQGPAPSPSPGAASTLAVPSYAGLALATLLSVLASMVFAQRF